MNIIFEATFNLFVTQVSFMRRWYKPKPDPNTIPTLTLTLILTLYTEPNPNPTSNPNPNPNPRWCYPPKYWLNSSDRAGLSGLTDWV